MPYKMIRNNIKLSWSMYLCKASMLIVKRVVNILKPIVIPSITRRELWQKSNASWEGIGIFVFYTIGKDIIQETI